MESQPFTLTARPLDRRFSFVISMSKNLRTLRLQRLQGRLGDVAHQLTKAHFSCFRGPDWQPAINAYRCEHCLRICVDLAGVDKDGIDLRLEPNRLLIRGRRDLPEPADSEGRAMQVLAMEIDHGQFEREILLPSCVQVDRVRAEQRNGLLWISLPLRHH
jgi:HSP20 family protein